MTPATWVALVAAVGLPAIVGLGLKAWYERRLLASQAASGDATATSIVTAAARELVDPLRRELALVRAEAKAGEEMERKKLQEVRAELVAATDEARALRKELAEVRAELGRVYRENYEYRARIAELERR